MGHLPGVVGQGKLPDAPSLACAFSHSSSLKAFGTQTALADVFFTRNTVTVNGHALPGLGLNVIRYNAGASSTNKDPDGATMVVSPNIKASRQIDTFWLDWTSTNPNSTSWSWTVDANQRNMMRYDLRSDNFCYSSHPSLAIARGANLVELFSNSPVWWMFCCLPNMHH
jgi:galactan endo-1,6-beta-galactosidase